MSIKALATALSISILSGGAMAADLGATDEPIKLAINEWTGQHVSTHVAGAMLEAAGYKVEYVTAGYMNMYQAMSDGEIHGAMEIWSSNVSEDYAKKVSAGGVERNVFGVRLGGSGIGYGCDEDFCPTTGIQRGGVDPDTAAAH